ncbi:uncharacterized protein METZ01_LOCUS515910, partial [marine metagenome]
MKMGFAPSEEQQLLRSSVKDMLKKFESRREEMHREI